MKLTSRFSITCREQSVKNINVRLNCYAKFTCVCNVVVDQFNSVHYVDVFNFWKTFKTEFHFNWNFQTRYYGYRQGTRRLIKYFLQFGIIIIITLINTCDRFWLILFIQYGVSFIKTTWLISWTKFKTFR